MSEQEDFVYDDEDAMRYIRNYLPQELKEKFSDDDIYYVLDLIYEYYESNGLFDDDADDIVDIDEEEVIEFVAKNAKRDGFTQFEGDDILFIIQGEFEYCEKMGVFE